MLHTKWMLTKTQNNRMNKTQWRLRAKPDPCDGVNKAKWKPTKRPLRLEKIWSTEDRKHFNPLFEEDDSKGGCISGSRDNNDGSDNDVKIFVLKQMKRYILMVLILSEHLLKLCIVVFNFLLIFKRQGLWD